jgi:ribosomal protein S18 acetylase RimI-like enzyme
MSSPQFHLRPAVASDLDAILALERATDLAPHWPPAAYADILESTDLGAPSIALGAPFIPRPWRNGWETSSPTPLQTTSDALQPVNATQRCLFVAEKNGQLAGFAVGLLHPATNDPANPASSGRVAELESVVVSASARRAGIGRALCRAVLDWSRSQGAAEVVLEVRANSTAAIALYSALGFTHAARRPRYYRGPEDDALLLRFVLQ